MAFKLNTQQKEEFRRLTQKANRRIAKAFKEYEASGAKIVPKQLTGGLVQTRSQWESQKYALSRSVTKFKTERDYRQYMNKLRQFDIPEVKGGVPTYTQYENINAMKMKQAMRTAMQGQNYRNLPDDIQKALEHRIDNMTVQEQKKFWKKFEKNAQQMGASYSSEGAMIGAMDEFFMKEDVKPMLIDSIIEAEPGLSKADQKEQRRKLKYYSNNSLIDYLKGKRGE